MHGITLTHKGTGSTTEVHMLNPGECLPGFGGSRQGLVARKTASLVTRSRVEGHVDDIERDIADPAFWKFLQRVINGEHPGAWVAEEPAPTE